MPPPGRGAVIRMVKLKGCPRCAGDLYLVEDRFGKYLSCLQCGYLRDVEKGPELRQDPEVVEEQSGAA